MGGDWLRLNPGWISETYGVPEMNDPIESLSINPKGESMRPPLKLINLLLLSMFSFSAAAAELHGVQMPGVVTVDGRPLKLNGLGVRSKTFLKIKVYVAGLYLESASNNPEQIIAADSIRRMEMQMTHNAPKDKLLDELLEGFKRNSKDRMPGLMERFKVFTDGIPDLKEGQELWITYVPGQGTSIRGTGGRQVTVPGKDFADAIFLAWLGRNPLDDDLKKHLLGTR